MRTWPDPFPIFWFSGRAWTRLRPLRHCSRQVDEVVAAARVHREMPFDRLVTELNPPKDMSRTALFDVLFSYHEAETQRGRVREVRSPSRRDEG